MIHRVLLAALLVATSAVADEITETIEGALSAYQKGEYKAASEDLGYAQQLIRQKRGDSFKQYMPVPLTGWTMGEIDVQTATAAMMGGGTTLSTTYHKGEGEVAIEMVADSPMLQSIAMMLSNPMFATADGGKMIRIKRHKAVIKYDKNGRSGEIKIVIDNRILVTITGTNVTEEELTAYAKAIDYDALAGMK